MPCAHDPDVPLPVEAPAAAPRRGRGAVPRPPARASLEAKDVMGSRSQDNFVRQGSSADQSSDRHRDQSSKIKPVKVSFYWHPETEQDVEQLRLRFFEKYQRKLTRSEIVEALVRNALKNAKILDELA